jgi:hypothetical protein
MAMTNKNELKIRMVTLDDHSLSNNAEGISAKCTCDGDCPTFDCRPQITPCDCDPQCNCDGNDEDQEQFNKGKKKHATFFKMG